MKFKTRLIFSFLVSVILPIILAAVALTAFYRIEVKSISQNYGIEKSELTSIFSNSVQLVNQYTKEEFRELQDDIKDQPEKLLQTSYLNTLNAKLLKKNSFIILLKNGEIYYNGMPEKMGISEKKWIEILPNTSKEGKRESVGYVYEGESKTLIKQLTLTTGNKEKLSAYMVTNAESLLPELRRLLTDMGIAIILILFLTSALMMLWIYRGTTLPLRKLKVATNNIKNGNLDFSIEYDVEDEVGELCKNFEQMRVRLKESTEEKVHSEQENRMLISNIAHDLKTPITAIKGYAEGILDGVADTKERRDKYLRTIYNKTIEMDRLINELMLYSKIDSNRIPYNFNKINVTSYFDDCFEEISLDMETKGVGVQYKNEVAPDTYIIADPEQLMRVINNIVTNAAKYMDKPQKWIRIMIKDVGDFIQIEIEDNGKGIATTDLPYIFDRFYRTDSSRNSSTGGSGIGLSIVKKIIEDHSGKIWATSREHIGTTMYFVLRKYQEVKNEQ